MGRRSLRQRPQSTQRHDLDVLVVGFVPVGLRCVGESGTCMVQGEKTRYCKQHNIKSGYKLFIGQRAGTHAVFYARGQYALDLHITVTAVYSYFDRPLGVGMSGIPIRSLTWWFGGIGPGFTDRVR